MSGALIRELRERSEALAEETRVRKEAQAMLVQTQKMESIGLLAGGVAHDFNNLMTVVIGNLDSVERRLARSGPADAAAIGRPIAAAMQGAKRAASLTQRLLAFSRQQVLAPQQVDLNRLVASLSDMLTRTVGETIAVETVARKRPVADVRGREPTRKRRRQSRRQRARRNAARRPDHH